MNCKLKYYHLVSVTFVVIIVLINMQLRPYVYQNVVTKLYLKVNKMNMKQFKKRMQDIEKQADEQLTALAEQVRQEVIIPYCDKHKLYFQQGNGTWSFWTGYGFAEKQPPKHIVDKIEPDDCHSAFRYPLFSYMQDYDARKI